MEILRDSGRITERDRWGLIKLPARGEWAGEEL